MLNLERHGVDRAETREPTLVVALTSHATWPVYIIPRKRGALSDHDNLRHLQGVLLPPTTIAAHLLNLWRAAMARTNVLHQMPG